VFTETSFICRRSFPSAFPIAEYAAKWLSYSSSISPDPAQPNEAHAGSAQTSG
jgi:hypothetical protein